MEDTIKDMDVHGSASSRPMYRMQWRRLKNKFRVFCVVYAQNTLIFFLSQKFISHIS